MKRIVISFLMLIALLGLSSVALAQEDPKDNACYAGGAWEGKCDWPTEAEDEWAWTCGWHYARVIDGRTSAAEAPATCKFIAEDDSTDPVDPVDPEPDTCMTMGDNLQVFSGQNGVANAPVNGFSVGTTYTILAPGVLANDTNCTEVTGYEVISSSDSLVSFVIAPDGSITLVFNEDSGFVNFAYTADGFAESVGNVALIETVCPKAGIVTFCVEGNGFTFSVPEVK